MNILELVYIETLYDNAQRPDSARRLFFFSPNSPERHNVLPSILHQTIEILDYRINPHIRGDIHLLAPSSTLRHDRVPDIDRTEGREEAKRAHPQGQNMNACHRLPLNNGYLLQCH